MADAHSFSCCQSNGDGNRVEKYPKTKGATTIKLRTLIAAEDKRKKALVSAMAAAVLGAGLIATAGAKPAEAAFGGQNGKIAFTSSRDGNHEIYSMNADSSNQKRLTNIDETEFGQTWSLDGKKIAFTSNATLRKMNADGSRNKPITSNGSTDFDPDWGVATQ